jgi:thioredoxin reductase
VPDPTSKGRTMTDVDVAVLGAGPHGLSATMHLRRAGVEVATVGDPMSFWRTMPKGMLLRSNWTATCIAEPQGVVTLDAYASATGRQVTRPVPLGDFIDYGTWVQEQITPDVVREHVDRLAKDGDGFRLHFRDGKAMRARRVVVAGGIAPFARRPALAERLPREMASHTADHDDYSRLSGRRVLVVGGGQSALESAALLHEAGADVQVVVRRPQIIWLRGGKYQRKLGRYAPLVYAPTDVGPMGLSRLVAAPKVFRRLPRRVQDPAAHRSIRPAGALWLRSRLSDVPIRLGSTVEAADPAGDVLRVQLSDGDTLMVDHVLFGTGYRVDVSRYPFLDAELARGIQVADGYPVLRRGLESSVPGLHFVGAPAAWSFGPILRFVSGGWFAGRSVAGAIAGADRAVARAGRATASAGAGPEGERT